MPALSTRTLTSAIAVGIALQLLMVIAGHHHSAVANLFAVGGMTISLIAGLLYALWAKQPSRGSSALGGAVAGGACALLGILVSYLLGDVMASVLVLGTLSSAVTGAIGSVIGHLIASRAPGGA